MQLPGFPEQTWQNFSKSLGGKKLRENQVHYKYTESKIDLDQKDCKIHSIIKNVARQTGYAHQDALEAKIQTVRNNILQI